MVCGQFQLWTFFCTGKCGTFHSHTSWLGVFSQCWHIMYLCLWETCLQKLRDGHLGWCKLQVPWVKHHTGGWLVCFCHSTWGVSATFCSRDLIFWKLVFEFLSNAKLFSFWGVHVAVQCDDWGGGWMFEGNSLLLRMTVVPASFEGVSSLWCLGSFLDLVSIHWLRTHHQRMSQNLVWWSICCCWKWVLLFGLHWTGLWCWHHGLSCPSHRRTHHHVWPILLGIGLQCHPFSSGKCQLILSPNGTQSNLYLPRFVLNIMRSEAASVRFIPKKALLPSTLKNLVAPVSTWVISLRVGALWFSWMMALFKSFGSRDILN